MWMDSIVVGRSFRLFCLLFCFSRLFYFFARIIHSFHSMLCVGAVFFSNACFGPSSLYFSNDPKRHQRIFPAHGIFLCISMCARASELASIDMYIHFLCHGSRANTRAYRLHNIFYFVRSRCVDRLVAIYSPHIHMSIHISLVQCYLTVWHVCVRASALVFCGSVLKFSPRFRF